MAILKRQNEGDKGIKKEFFGLRDFYRYDENFCLYNHDLLYTCTTSKLYFLPYYSMVKMLYWMCEEAKCNPNVSQINHVVLRNFSGYEGFDPLEMFSELQHFPPAPSKKDAEEEWLPRLREEFRKDKQAHSNLREMFLQVNGERLRSEYTRSDDNTEDEFLSQEFDQWLESDEFHDEEVQHCYEEEFEKYFHQKFERKVI